MKPLILSGLFAVLSITASAQNDCEAIKKENEYLKQALLLNKPVTEISDGDITLSILSIEGSRNAQEVSIEVLITNKGLNLDAFTTRVKSIIDINGSEYLLDKAYLGAKEASGFMSAFIDLYRDTPLKCRYVFRGIQPEVKMIKMFMFPFEYHIPGTNSFDNVKKNVEFRDLNITWK